MDVRKYLVLFVTAFLTTIMVFMIYDKTHTQNIEQYTLGGDTIVLPEPRYKSSVSVEEAMLKRRSRRDYTVQPLTLFELSQLLWSAQGITSRWGGRTAPSAGATYPLEVFVVVGDVEGLPPGVYHYLPVNNSLERILDGDFRGGLWGAGLNQGWIKNAPVNLVFVGFYERTTTRYNERGRMYVHMEAGHAAQNVYLQAESLGLGTVVIGAFYEGEVQKLLHLPEDGMPLYIMPVGKPT